MSKKLKVGMVTIGQTPREDLICDLKRVVGSDVSVVIYGALDGLTRTEINNLVRKEDEPVLVVKLADGSWVKIAKRYIYPRIQSCIDRMQNEDVDLIVIACTDVFPRFKSEKLVLKPSVLLSNVVAGLITEVKLGVFVPIIEQVAYAAKKWSRKGVDVYVEVALPWDYEEVLRAAEKMRKMGVDLIVLDCYGYSSTVKEKIRKTTRKLVISPSTLIARLVKELLL